MWSFYMSDCQHDQMEEYPSSGKAVIKLVSMICFTLARIPFDTSGRAVRSFSAPFCWGVVPCFCIIYCLFWRDTHE